MTYKDKVIEIIKASYNGRPDFISEKVWSALWLLGFTAVLIGLFLAGPAIAIPMALGIWLMGKSDENLENESDE